MDILVNREVDRDWALTDPTGIERSVLRRNEQGGRTFIIRMKKGAHYPQHKYQGHAEIMILNGQVLISGVELSKGDYLHTRRGEAHDIVALTDAELFISTEQAMTLIT
ncbi:cupin domain-containing protein [Methylophaga thiooxydans]|uniref:cupin domain-containing protein n=1 Tax=Methylophaga thiooxydans TaxID=392484 RepID=UPI002355D18F|nr:cupin domain-containing protein [Methylophaga thiooxydans]